jgi:hypothetical protein
MKSPQAPPAEADSAPGSLARSVRRRPGEAPARQPPGGRPFGPEHHPARQARRAADLAGAGAIVSIGGRLGGRGPESLQKASSLGALFGEIGGPGEAILGQRAIQPAASAMVCLGVEPRAVALSKGDAAAPEVRGPGDGLGPRLRGAPPNDYPQPGQLCVPPAGAGADDFPARLLQRGRERGADGVRPAPPRTRAKGRHRSPEWILALFFKTGGRVSAFGAKPKRGRSSRRKRPRTPQWPRTSGLSRSGRGLSPQPRH